MDKRSEDKPFICNTLVIKVASRCNLNCSYCYMYNLGDTTYLEQPKLMSKEIIDQLIFRVKEHAIDLNLDSFSFVFHGGEPLLARKAFYLYFVGMARKELSFLKLHFTLQTNGTLLTNTWCRLFDSLDIRIGISIDGPKNNHDQYRIDHAGKGSYDRVLRGFQLAHSSPFLHHKPGVLSVININASPLETYTHLLQLGAKQIDFLLPEATYEKPPPLPGLDKWWYSLTPYANWLIAIFDKWILEKEQVPVIRQFQLIIHSILGGVFTADNLGSLHNEVLVIETDGGIEAVDGLKSCGHGFTKAGAHLKDHSLSEALQTRLARLYYLSHELLPLKCLACPVNETCGGGTIIHRYSPQNGFNNPSVYCNDLLKLITHIQNAIIPLLPPELVKETGIKPLDHFKALRIIQELFPTIQEPDYIRELKYQ